MKVKDLISVMDFNVNKLLNVGYFDEDFENDYFYNELGKEYKIRKLSIEGNTYKMLLSVDGIDITEPKTGKFKTLFDLWEAFGGAYSTDGKGNFNEGSNELLYKVITTADSNGKYPLKDKIIHVISNLSAVKAGATNVNNLVPSCSILKLRIPK